MALNYCTFSICWLRTTTSTSIDILERQTQSSDSPIYQTDGVKFSVCVCVAYPVFFCPMYKVHLATQRCARLHSFTKRLEISAQKKYPSCDPRQIHRVLFSKTACVALPEKRAKVRSRTKNVLFRIKHIAVMCDSNDIEIARVKPIPIPTLADNPVSELTDLCTQRGYRFRYNLNIRRAPKSDSSDFISIAIASCTVQYCVHDDDDSQTFELPPVTFDSISLPKHEKRRLKESIYRVALSAVKQRAQEEIPPNVVPILSICVKELSTDSCYFILCIISLGSV